METEFLKLIGEKGFTANSWAYTCDKTIKAFRTANISLGMIAPVQNYQNKIYNKEFADIIDYEDMQMQYAVMQSVAEMYRTNMQDVMEVRREKKFIYDEIIKIKSILIDSPLMID